MYKFNRGESCKYDKRNKQSIQHFPKSVLFIFLLIFRSWTLNGDSYVILIRSDHNFFLFGLDPKESEIVSGIEISDHASCFFVRREMYLA